MSIVLRLKNPCLILLDGFFLGLWVVSSYAIHSSALREWRGTLFSSLAFLCEVFSSLGLCPELQLSSPLLAPQLCVLNLRGLLGFVWVPTPILNCSLETPQAVNWNNFRALLICFSSPVDCYSACLMLDVSETKLSYILSGC